MFPLVPVLLVGGGAFGLYELHKRAQAKKAGTDQPSHSGGNPLPGSAPSAPAPQQQNVRPPSSSPLTPPSSSLPKALNSSQPQPPNQPPLPPVTTDVANIAPGQMAIVNTSQSGQAGNLRVRSGPSTTAPAVPGGEPSMGGGVPKGEQVQVTGPVQNDMTPIYYAATNLRGWGYAGYLKTAGMNAEMQAADVGSLPNAGDPNAGGADAVS